MTTISDIGTRGVIKVKPIKLAETIYGEQIYHAYEYGNKDFYLNANFHYDTDNIFWKYFRKSNFVEIQ